MAGQSQTAHYHVNKAGKHVHHGRTPAAWAGTMVALAAILLGAIALVAGPQWVLFWISVALLVLSLVVTKVLQVMGFGAN